MWIIEQDSLKGDSDIRIDTLNKIIKRDYLHGAGHLHFELITF